MCSQLRQACWDQSDAQSHKLLLIAPAQLALLPLSRSGLGTRAKGICSAQFWRLAALRLNSSGRPAQLCVAKALKPEIRTKQSKLMSRSCRACPSAPMIPRSYDEITASSHLLLKQQRGCPGCAALTSAVRWPKSACRQARAERSVLHASVLARSSDAFLAIPIACAMQALSAPAKRGTQVCARSCHLSCIFHRVEATAASVQLVNSNSA